MSDYGSRKHWTFAQGIGAESLGRQTAVFASRDFIRTQPARTASKWLLPISFSATVMVAVIVSVADDTV